MNLKEAYDNAAEAVMTLEEVVMKEAKDPIDQSMITDSIEHALEELQQACIVVSNICPCCSTAIEELQIEDDSGETPQIELLPTMFELNDERDAIRMVMYAEPDIIHCITDWETVDLNEDINPALVVCLRDMADRLERKFNLSQKQ